LQSWHNISVEFLVTVNVVETVVVSVTVVVDVVVVVLLRQRANPSAQVRISGLVYATQKRSPLSLTQGPAVPASHRSSLQLYGSTVGALVGATITVAVKLSTERPKHSFVFSGHVRDAASW
jgi:hypothetical protein